MKRLLSFVPILLFTSILTSIDTFEVRGQPPAVTVRATYISVKEVFRSQGQVYSLAAIPQSDADVFLNGLLQLSGVDYTISGNTLTFTGQTIGANPIIQVRYWTIH